MREIIEYFQKEWATLSAAPFTFILFGVLVCGLAYAACRWRYDSVIEVLRERLAAKDQKLDEYRERIQQGSAKGKEFTQQPHAELQTVTLEFVAQLRTWLASRKAEENRKHALNWNAMASASDERTKQHLWDSNTMAMLSSASDMLSTYDAEFKIKAIVLRDEWHTRLGNRTSKANSRSSHLYEHPTNMIGIGEVADDLELMARSNT